jgi:endonuclease/exonuclease/phosphatase family metal-dependent hydrolase
MQCNMMKCARFIVTATLLLSSIPVLSCPKPDCVRIGTWNIAWLGSEKREQSSAPATIESMARLIADEWSIDLIGLEEINTELNGKIRGENYTTSSWKTLRIALEKRGYKTFSGGSGQAQRIVFAWRHPVKILQFSQEIEIPDSYYINEYCRSSGLRKPLAGHFRAGNFDFMTVAVHLKSGYGNNAACSNAIRSSQVEHLSKQLDILEKKDRDLILIGDFNASAKHESLKKLSENNFIVLTEKKYRNPDSNNRSQGAGKRGSTIDHIMIKQANTDELVSHSTVLYKPEKPEFFAANFSDHMPIWADFKTANDDD